MYGLRDIPFLNYKYVLKFLQEKAVEANGTFLNYMYGLRDKLFLNYNYKYGYAWNQKTSYKKKQKEEKRKKPKPEEQEGMPQRQYCPPEKRRGDRNPECHKEQQKDVA
jgi:hypothetical protein